MKNKITIPKETWYQIDEKSLKMASEYEQIETLSNKLIEYFQDKNRINLEKIRELANTGYKKVCDFNHELLTIFDY